MPKIALADKLDKSIIESLVDGEGVRLVLFTCGCPHKCEDCHNNKTWDIRNGVFEEIDKVAKYLNNKLSKGRYSGITISGGDPIFQNNELYILLKILKNINPDINIWCYTGFTFEKIKELPVLKYIDVLVDGRFEKDKKYPKKKYRGSYNQRVIRLEDSKIISIE